MSRMIVCAVSGLALLASTPRLAQAGFRGTVQRSNEQVNLRFVAVTGAPTQTTAAVTIFELGADKVRDVISVSLELAQEQEVHIPLSRNTHRIAFEVDLGAGAAVRVGVSQGIPGFDSPVFPDETVSEDTRYVLDVR